MEFIFTILFYYLLIKFIIKKYNDYRDKKFRKYYLELREKEKEKNKYQTKHSFNDNNATKEIKYNNLGFLKYQVIPNYKKQNYVMTYEELKLYRILNNLANKYNYVIFPQVILYSLISVNNKNRETELFNKIRSKSIDFVICNNENGKIIFCIELDDETHQYKNRIKRDLFLNEIFEEVNIPLVHIQRKNQYDLNEIENIIRNKI